jgi:alkanesulfonate monooxygenase SsuD/methylene tetrahydromethanopterin reductase-like flavin-dependent oxidoreductase (luciferase family)
MKLGISLPIGPADGPGRRPATWDEFREVAEAAEAAGLDSVWSADHFGMHESWTMLSAVTAVTTRVQVGTIVMCSTFRDPGLAANMAATLDRVSGGRLILGVGCGGDENEHRTFGLPNDHRVSRFGEWLECVVRLLRAETVTFDGRYHQLHEARIEPPPERTIPVFVAAGGPRMRAITEQWADARLAAWYGMPSEAEIEPYVGVVVRDPDQPPIPTAEPYALAGSVEEVAAVLADYAARGVEHLIVLNEPISVRSVERLAEAWRLAQADTLVDRG